MRGFLGGVSIGAVIAVLGAAGLSLITPLAQPPEVGTKAPGETSQQDDSGASLASGSVRDADLVEAAPAAPAEVTDGSGNIGALDSSVTDPGEKPQVGNATDALAEPDAGGEVPQIAVTGDDQVTGNQITQAPDAPDAETGVSAPSEPARPVVTGEAPESAGGQVAVLTEAPSLPAAEDPVTGTGLVSGTPTPASESVPEVDTTAAEAPDPQPVAPSEAAEPAETTPEEPAEEQAPRIAALPQTGTENTGDSPRIGTPVVPLTERNKPAQPEVSEPETSEPVVPPIEAFAAEFSNPESKPLMSIVLIDDEDAVGAEALLDFPYPLSFAINPSDPQAQDKMARYRAAGFEVVVLADFPAAATPGDAETALEVWFGDLSESVALLEGIDGGIQGNRALSDQVTAVVDAGGRGLITQDRGLNTVQKLAARDGVPSGVVFRDFDGAGQTPTVMRRFLDQAAFRAGQEGAVIMLGRVQPDTISALLLWGLQDRASRVALAPVSASLLLER